MIIKRVFDLIASVIGLIVIMPLLFIIGVLIKLKMPGGPVLFKQKRVGQNAKLFTMYKFRSMSNKHSGSSISVAGESRITPLGSSLRKYKLDELPELWNVLVGDMSLVGPRPCLEVTRNEMPEWALQRFSLRPGMTGLAQINGNISLSWQERWEYDTRYIEQCSLYFDFKIIIKTVLVVLLGEERFRRDL